MRVIILVTVDQEVLMGKFSFTEELNRFDFEDCLEDGVELYSKVVWSVNLRRKIKVALFNLMDSICKQNHNFSRLGNGAR